jgi:hypothetical protein
MCWISSTLGQTAGFERRMTKFAEEQLMYPGESLTEAVSRSQVLQSASEEGNDYTTSFSTALSWGTVYALDAANGEPTQLFYTKSVELNPNYPPNYNYYVGANFTFYNENFEQVYQIQVAAPTLEDGTTFAQCNDIQIVGDYSKSLYNSDSQWEFLFMTHWFKPDAQGKTGPDTQQYTYSIYQGNGALYHTLENTEGVYQYAGSTNNTRKLIVGEWQYEADTAVMKVYSARNLKAGTGLLKTHKIAMDQMVRMTAPLIIVETIDGVPRYAFPHYEQKYYSTGYPNWTVNPENKFILDMYSLDVANAATDNLYKSISLPIEGFDPDKISSVDFAVTFPDYDLTSNVFNDDAGLEVLYGVRDYYVSCDCEFTNFYVADETGTILKTTKTFSPDIRKVKRLADLPGYGRQYAIFADADNTTEISFFDIEDWTVVQKFPSVYKNEQLTSNFDRTLTDTGYAYVFEMYATFKEGNDVYSKVNWYDAATGDLLKTVKFNTGPKGVYFSPAITPTTLNPYFINTDDKMEYIGAARIYDTTGNAYSSFRIYNEDGDLLFKSDANDAGKPFSGGMGAYATGGTSQYLILVYTTGVYDFIHLPLTSFAGGGDGTDTAPYVIATAGDLDLVRVNLEASYVLANDIDMSALLATKYAVGGWKSIDGFKGKLDGKGHNIRNFKLNNSSSSTAALIGDMGSRSGAQVWVKNLRMADAEITTNSANMYSGFLVGYMSGPTSVTSPDSVYIRNCHVTGTITQGASFPTNGIIGGIAGQATSFSGIIESDFSGSIRNTASATAVNPKIGGILGNSMTSAYVKACRSEGEIIIENGATTALGGIVGSVQNGVSVKNSYSTMNIKGGTDVGGIVGSFTRTPKGLVQNCYATGNLVAERAGGNYFAGGVIGSTDQNTGHLEGYYPNQTVHKTNVNMSGLLALNDNVTALYANRVSGKSANALGADGCEAVWGVPTLDSIRYCYALPTLKFGPAGAEATVHSTNANSLDGADITIAELTEEFYTTIGWEFGKSVDSPWIWNESGKPRLWYEYSVTGVSLDNASVLIDVQASIQLLAVLSPIDALNQKVSWTSSDPEVASVDDGLVTGLKFGTTTITVTTEEGEYTATCEVTVRQEVTIKLPEANGVSVSNAKGRIEISTLQMLDQVTVYDVKGNRMYISEEKTNRISIPTNHWNKGVYVVRVISNTNISYKKLIIQ